jgi:hypothetical protein
MYVHYQTAIIPTCLTWQALSAKGAFECPGAVRLRGHDARMEIVVMYGNIQ